MDVVIPYKEVRSQELEWAVESLNNIRNKGEVYVIHDAAVKDIEWANLNKYANQLAKYVYACTETGISSTFLASNDDFFVLDGWNPINYNKGTLEQHIKLRGRNDLYTKSLRNTKEWLEARNLPTLSFELHTPFLYDREAFLSLVNEIDITLPMQIRSLYGNYYGVETEYMEDVKNIKDFHGKILLSTDDRTFKGEIGQYIREVLGE